MFWSCATLLCFAIYVCTSPADGRVGVVWMVLECLWVWVLPSAAQPVEMARHFHTFSLIPPAGNLFAVDSEKCHLICNVCACVIARGRRTDLQSPRELPHHLLPWQLNSQEWKRRNEGRQAGEGRGRKLDEKCMFESGGGEDVGERRKRGGHFQLSPFHSRFVCSAGWRIRSLIFVVEGCSRGVHQHKPQGSTGSLEWKRAYFLLSRSCRYTF